MVSTFSWRRPQVKLSRAMSVSYSGQSRWTRSHASNREHYRRPEPKRPMSFFCSHTHKDPYMPATQIRSCNTPALEPEGAALLLATPFAPLPITSLPLGVVRSCLPVYSEETSRLIGAGCLVLAMSLQDRIRQRNVAAWVRDCRGNSSKWPTKRTKMPIHSANWPDNKVETGDR